MNENSIIALKTLINVKNYEDIIKDLKYELYHSNNNLNKLVKNCNKNIDCHRTRNDFRFYTDLDTITCCVKNCDKTISTKISSTYNIIYNSDNVVQSFLERKKNKTYIICKDCNSILLKNNISFNNSSNISKEEWENIKNKKYNFLDYENKIELLQKENMELKKYNLEFRSLVNNIIDNKLDNSKIMLEIFSKSNFYKDVDKSLVKLEEI